MNHRKRIPTSKVSRRLGIALIITVSIAVGELTGGILSNSLALIGDAGHMITDALAISLSLFAFHLSSRPATRERTFGLLRVEILAALANGALLFFVALFLIYEGIRRLDSPPLVNAEIMLPVAAIGLLANIAGAAILRAHAKHNLNLRGAFYHMLSDAASSVAVIVGGFLIILTGEQIVDPIVSFVIAALILRGSLHLLSQSVNILVEAVPPHIDLDEMTRDIKDIAEIKDVHDLHVWTITSGVYALSGHILIDNQMVGDCARIIEKINNLLEKKYSILHATWQLECEACQEEYFCDLTSNR